MPNDQGKKPVVHSKKHIARLERERRQSRLILYAFIGILVIVVGLLIYGYIDLHYLQAKRPVAKVGKTSISVAQFESQVRLQRQRLLVQYSQMQYYQAFGLDVSSQIQQITSSLDDSQTLGNNVLNQMVDDEIIRQEAAKRGITVSKEEVDQFIQSAYQYFPNGTPSPTPTATEVVFPTIPAQAFELVTITPTPSVTPTATLEVTAELPTETPAASSPTQGTESVTTGTPAPTNTPLPTETPTATATLEPTATPTLELTSTPEPTATPYTLEGFQAEYEKASKDFAKFGFSADDYRQLFETQLLHDKLYADVTKDIPHTEDQVWARHILVADEETAKKVIERLKNGEDFGALAKELSQDTGSGANGGDLGWFGKGKMVAPFEAAAFSLKPGEISDPVKSDFGYHIIQVIAHQERPLTADAYKQATDKAFSDFLAASRQDLGVVTYDDLWKSHVPTEPNLNTMATEQVKAAATAQAETAKAPSLTPTP